MSYIMVPVPEEHAEEVRRYARWGVNFVPGADAWDQDAVAQLLRDYDEAARTLVVRAAEAELGDEQLTVGTAAGALGCSVREILGLTAEINDAIRGAGGPPIVFMTEKPDGADDRVPKPEAWRLCVVDKIARFLLAAESAKPSRESADV